MLSSSFLLLPLISTSLPALASVLPQNAHSLLDRDYTFTPATHRSMLEAFRRGTQRSPSFPFEAGQFAPRQTTESDLPTACEHSCSDDEIEANTPACVSNSSDPSCTCEPDYLSDVEQFLACVGKEAPDSDVFIGPGGVRFTVSELVSALQSICDISLPTITGSALVTTGRSSAAHSSTGRTPSLTLDGSGSAALHPTTAGGGTVSALTYSTSSQGMSSGAVGKVEVGKAFSLVAVSFASLLALSP